MRATYRREQRAKELIEQSGVSAFVPMHLKQVERGGKPLTLLAPIISSLIFVRCTKLEAESLQRKIPYLQYIYHTREERREPITIPEDQMLQFIKVVESKNEKLIYLEDAQLPLSKAIRVRVTEGDFKGFEGLLTKLKGVRDRRVVLNLEGVLSVALTVVDSKNIEYL